MWGIITWHPQGICCVIPWNLGMIPSTIWHLSSPLVLPKSSLMGQWLKVSRTKANHHERLVIITLMFPKAKATGDEATIGRKDAIRIFIPWHLAYDHSKISNINAHNRFKKKKKQNLIFQNVHLFHFIRILWHAQLGLCISKHHIGFLHDNHLLGYKKNDCAQSLWWTPYFLLALTWSVASLCITQ